MISKPKIINKKIKSTNKRNFCKMLEASKKGEDAIYINEKIKSASLSYNQEDEKIFQKYFSN